jgi:hypothetical protein
MGAFLEKRVVICMKALPVVVLAGATCVLAACGSSPVEPSPTPTPTPNITTVFQPAPVPAENTIALSAPASGPSSADPLVGRYTLEIDIAGTSGFRCDTITPQARRRTYTADIQPFRTYYAVKLYDATFLRDASSRGYSCRDSRLEMGGVCHQFILEHAEGSSVSVVMENDDESRGSQIWEVLPMERRVLEFTGRGTGSVGDGRIVASGRGGNWYGDGIPASDFAGCNGDMTWTFTRR